MIQIKLYHCNFKYLSVFVNYFLKILNFSNIEIQNQFFKLIKINNYTLLKSPHVFKKSQETFGGIYYMYTLRLIKVKNNLNIIKYIYYILNKSNCFFKVLF